jgi:hypothetical protein
LSRRHQEVYRRYQVGRRFRRRRFLL